MSEIFISHVEEDQDIAVRIADCLEKEGYSTWYFERDKSTGLSYLHETREAITQSKAVLLIISPRSIIDSDQVDKEVVHAHECRKPFIPLLYGITFTEFVKRQPAWKQALGASTLSTVTKEGLSTLVESIVRGLKKRGIEPALTMPSPIPIPSPQPENWPRRLWQRKPYVIYAAATVMVISVALAIYFFLIKPKLTPIARPIVEEFYNLNNWQVPKGWDCKERRVYIENQKKLGFLKGVSYGDFTMSFNLKLENGGGAAWVLRMKGSNQYYMFYLSGPEGLIPCGLPDGEACKFATYFINGNPDVNLDQHASLMTVLTELKEGGEYRIDITAKNNLIIHEITNLDPDPDIPPEDIKTILGRFEDLNNSFLNGGIGFRTVGSEKFSIANLVIDPVKNGQ